MYSTSPGRLSSQVPHQIPEKLTETPYSSLTWPPLVRNLCITWHDSLSLPLSPLSLSVYIHICMYVRVYVYVYIYICIGTVLVWVVAPAGDRSALRRRCQRPACARDAARVQHQTRVARLFTCCVAQIYGPNRPPKHENPTNCGAKAQDKKGIPETRHLVGSLCLCSLLGPYNHGTVPEASPVDESPSTDAQVIRTLRGVVLWRGGGVGYHIAFL